MSEETVVVGLRAVSKEFVLRPERGRKRVLRAVDAADLVIRRGTTTGLVGESGSGKSTLGRLVSGLETPDAGSISVFGDTLRYPLRGQQRETLRRGLQMVFQDPYSSFDPSARLGSSIAEPLRAHAVGSRAARRAAVVDALETVGLAADYVDRLPKQMSGGQLQRAAIARALILKPRVILLDEAVSALDVSTQAQVVNLLEEIQARTGVAYLFISHDLAVVRHVSDRIAVMYLGRIVEEGPAEEIYERPKHPYTAALLAAVPRVSTSGRVPQRYLLKGEAPSATRLPSGCRFRTRCPFAMEVCAQVDPPETVMPDGGTVRCHLQTSGPALGGRSVRDLAASKLALDSIT